jgi:hypothetical protein
MAVESLGTAHQIPFLGLLGQNGGGAESRAEAAEQRQQYSRAEAAA